MATHLRDIFMTRLRNAHAMEDQTLSITKPQISRIENYPHVEARLELHDRETVQQIARLEEILHSQQDSA
ncbi:UNVERIFIED_ORG: ferritin-like metal-binding protein YciE [Rhizobium nepotum]|nr:ferritin-like metal-binding protein YciE [Rhizobium nepotum]